MNEKLNLVKIDGQVVLKIAKHCRENFPEIVTGSLLGLDEHKSGVLEVTNCFPLPDQNDEDAVDAETYQVEMMKYLREMNFDYNNVGWYTTSYDLNLDSLRNRFFVQSKFQSAKPRTILITYDPISTVSNGSLSLHAYRISDKVMSLNEHYITKFIIQEKNLTFKDLFEEIPIEITNSGLAKAFTGDLITQSSLKLNVDTFDLNSHSFMERNLERVTEDLAQQSTDITKYKTWSQTYAKSINIWNKRQSENAQLRLAGKPTLPESMKELEQEFPQTFRAFPEEPNRLDYLLRTDLVNHFCEQIEQSARADVLKLSLLKGINEETSE